jgi:hypothetical protein
MALELPRWWCQGLNGRSLGGGDGVMNVKAPFVGESGCHSSSAVVTMCTFLPYLKTYLLFTQIQ